VLAVLGAATDVLIKVPGSETYLITATGLSAGVETTFLRTIAGKLYQKTREVLNIVRLLSKETHSSYKYPPKSLICGSRWMAKKLEVLPAWIQKVFECVVEDELCSPNYAKVYIVLKWAAIIRRFGEPFE
jgi:hypothetical protein